MEARVVDRREGRLEAAGSHAKLGSGEFIVVEADESDASFLYLAPVLAVVTNIDADHMETYGHYFGRLRQAFLDFVQHLPFYGTAVLCIDDANVREILPAVTKPVTTYGLSESAQIRAVDVKANAGRMRFRVVRSDAQGKTLADLVGYALAHLPAREQFIIRNRYFSGAKRTLASIGHELNLSKDRVRQLEARALATLRDVLGTGLAQHR